MSAAADAGKRRNAPSIHRDALLANRLRVRAQFAYVMASAFIAEHERSGTTFDTIATRLGITADEARKMLEFRRVRGNAGVDVLADLTMALDVEMVCQARPIFAGRDQNDNKPEGASL